MSHRAIVAHYIQNNRPRSKDELDWYASQPTFQQAVESAALAMNSKGKRHNHQRRIPGQALAAANSVLLLNLLSLQDCPSFEELFGFMDDLLLPIRGIGELYIYDTSLRIGAYLKLYPQKVYLHAGTRRGAKALRKAGYLRFSDDEESIDQARFPSEFCELEPREIEDILCIYKDYLKQEKADDVLPRRNC